MMINCVVYADGKRQADIAIDELPHVLASSEGFAWIALKDPVPTEILMLQEILDLPELAVASAPRSRNTTGCCSSR